MTSSPCPTEAGQRSQVKSSTHSGIQFRQDHRSDRLRSVEFYQGKGCSILIVVGK